MKKIIYFLFIFLFLIFPKNIYAADFEIAADVTYEINTDSTTKITHNINLKNLTTEKYSPSFTFALNGLSARDFRAYDSNGEIKIQESENNNQKFLELLFSDKVVGKNKSRNFILEITDDKLLKKTGDITEISIPKLSDDTVFDAYDVRFKVPKSIGDLAYMVPEATSSLDSETHTIYYFEKDQLSDVGVSAAFGNFQTFSFNLSYHLENQNITPSESTISLPPDTQYQQVYYEKLEPKPENIEITEEGNWIAKYNLGPRERKDIKLIGFVKIFSDPIFKETVSEDYLAKNLQPTQFWQSDNPTIKSLANQLGTPENIYNYVVENLKYNYGNATPSKKRLGAAAAINLPDQAICTEFTDLFIALSRAAGIPAREVNGYAATENPNLQPLSLVADVLHAWPEYWDYDRKIWVPVDPTWGHTTGGVDYFSKLDLRHFSFVFHGISDTEPSPPGAYKLGSNPQKDVYVNFSDLPKIEKSNLNIKIHQSDGPIFFNPSLVIEIYNPGPTAVYSQQYNLVADGKIIISDSIDSLLPFNTEKLEFELPYGFLGSKMPESVKFTIDDIDTSITLNKTIKIIKDITIVLSIVLIIVGFVFWYFKK